jgi:hypothetical protein
MVGRQLAAGEAEKVRREVARHAGMGRDHGSES